MDIFRNTDLAKWQQGTAVFEDFLAHYQCTTAQLAEVLDIPNSENVVAVRHCEDWWPNAYVYAIKEVRREYDAGLVEIITGRHGNHFFLFRIVRQKKDEKRYYFSINGNGIEH